MQSVEAGGDWSTLTRVSSHANLRADNRIHHNFPRHVSFPSYRLDLRFLLPWIRIDVSEKELAVLTQLHCRLQYTPDTQKSSERYTSV